LDAFTTALENYHAGNARQYDLLIMRLFVGPNPEKQKTYEYLMECCSYVSRLTDGNALQIFQKLRGIL
jgi:dGTPase